MEGRTVLQWDKEDCADAGLVKFDLLGLGMLTAIRYAFEAIAASQGVLLELHYLPDDDPAVYDLLCAADTVGVFQVESRAQMATLPRLKPRTFYDLVVEVALIRPGPIQGGSVHPYINRRNGREPVTYLHPLLESSLKRTLGIPLFQEQLMQMAIDVAGFSPAESDQLRRAMGSKRSLERMQALRDRLMSGMIANGVTPQARERIYEQLQGFADFGFPESHAFSFAFLVYASSWLKVHYPAEFYMGLLAAQPMGFYSPQSLCADARRHGVTVLRPCLNSSEALASVEALSEDVELPPEQLKIPRSPDESFGPEPNLRTAVREGLAQVRGISKEKAKEIVAERRARGPFRSQHDLARRVQLSTTQLESLATAGAMTTFGVTRRAGIWEADALAGESLAMLPGIGEGVSAPDLPTMSPVEAVMADAAATGITPDRLAIEFVRERLSADGVASVSVAMAGNPGTRIAVGGAVTHRQRPGTAGGVTFLSLEDETGLLNVVCQQKVWEQHREVARRARAMVVWGRLEKSDGATNLLAEHLAPLRLPVLAGSRDFR
jgi:error-prone DNA polymerase